MVKLPGCSYIGTSSCSWPTKKKVILQLTLVASAGIFQEGGSNFGFSKLGEDPETQPKPSATWPLPYLTVVPRVGQSSISCNAGRLTLSFNVTCYFQSSFYPPPSPTYTLVSLLRPCVWRHLQITPYQVPFDSRGHVELEDELHNRFKARVSLQNSVDKGVGHQTLSKRLARCLDVVLK